MNKQIQQEYEWFKGWLENMHNIKLSETGEEIIQRAFNICYLLGQIEGQDRAYREIIERRK